jgi:hypothetical protein
MTDFADMIAAIDACNAASAGNFEPLIARLDKLTDHEITWLAAELRGEHKTKRGRPPLRQTTGDHMPIKERFADNNDIDLAAWDAFNFMIRAEGKSEAAAKSEIAQILGETAKNVSHRLNRIKAHLATGELRAAYRTNADGDVRQAVELLAEAFARMGIAADPALQFPMLLAIGRK